MRFDRFPSIPDPVSLPVGRKPDHRLQLVPLAEDLVAAFFDASDAETVPTSQLAAWSGDEALCRPLLGTRLARRGGGLRYVFFVARSSRDLCRRGLWIARDDRPLAEIDPSALQSPVVDALALVVGLSTEGEARLLRALLTTGLSLFGDRAFPGIRDIVLQLLERLAPPPLALRAWCPLGRTAAIASYALPRDHAVDAIGNLVAITGAAAQQLSGVEAEFETLGDDRLLHLFLPRGMGSATTLVALSDPPLRLAGQSPAQPPRPLGPWLARRTPQIRRRLLDRLTSLAAQDETVASLAGEVTCPDAARPEVRPHLICCTPSGVFYVAGVSDPRRLLREMVLRTDGGDILLPLGAPLHHPRLGSVQLGHVPTSLDGRPGDAGALYAHYRSGRMTRIGPVTLEPMPRVIPALLEDLPAAAVAPALASALADMLADRPTPRGDVIEIAPPTGTPRATLVVQLDGSPDYPFALAATLVERRDVTLLLHHPDRRARATLQNIGAELHAIYGIGVALFDMAEDDVLPSERLRAALAGVRTDAAIVLTGDALPARRPWLEPWLAKLDRPGPVLAAAATGGLDAGPEAEALAPGAEAAIPAASPGTDAAPLCFGLNSAAREKLSAMPLRVAGREADLADLAAALRREPGARVSFDPTLRLVAHAPAPTRPAALTLAERLILGEKDPA